MHTINAHVIAKADKLLNACYPMMRHIQFSNQQVSILRSMMSLSRKIEDFEITFFPTEEFFEINPFGKNNIPIQKGPSKDAALVLIQSFQELYTLIKNSPIVFPEPLHNNLIKAIDLLKPLEKEYQTI